ncbi:hypothetical protein C0992_004790 [Termitomyces sp. T32_za158]|nr:hypothetical protein C0992_004790 [Termitomyces sp. T32_za158]
MAPPTLSGGGTSSSPPVMTEAEEAELHRGDNSTPVIMQIKVSLHYAGDLLAKDDGKWTPWSKYMKLELTMCGLYEYIFDLLDIPHQLYKPRAHRNWQLNNRLARSIY